MGIIGLPLHLGKRHTRYIETVDVGILLQIYEKKRKDKILKQR